VSLFPAICDSSNSKRWPSLYGVLFAPAIVEPEHLFIYVAVKMEEVFGVSCSAGLLRLFPHSRGRLCHKLLEHTKFAHGFRETGSG
jgi:hypothetical protein